MSPSLLLPVFILSLLLFSQLFQTYRDLKPYLWMDNLWLDFRMELRFFFFFSMKLDPRMLIENGVFLFLSIWIIPILYQFLNE